MQQGVKFSRRGNCLVIAVLIGACFLGGLHFLFKKINESEEKQVKPRKPVIKTFPHDISGKWQALLVKVNPPKNSPPGWKPSWMQSNYRDFDAVVEIDKAYFIRRLKWVELKNNMTNVVIEWSAPDKWQYMKRISRPRMNEERGESTRDGKRLKVAFTGGSQGCLRECSFEFNDMPQVPDKYQFDGGFREAETRGEIEGEILLYAPEIKDKQLDIGKMRVEVTPFGFQLWNEEYVFKLFGQSNEVYKLLSQETKVPFTFLKKHKIDKVRGGVLKQLSVEGYPGMSFLTLKNCDCQFWFGDAKGEGDRVFVNLPTDSQAVLSRAEGAKKNARVVFSADGKGRMFTHDGVLEYELSR